MTLRDAIECVDDDAEVYADYAARFAGYNADQAGWVVDTFSMILRQDGRIVAGGRGHVYLGALEVRGLWVDDALRGTGLGSDLLNAIEAEARKRGAKGAMLYTYSWQAEGFYRKHGYVEYARYAFPDGHARIDMKKDFPRSNPAAPTG